MSNRKPKSPSTMSLAVAAMKTRVQDAAGAREWVLLGIVEEVAEEFKLDASDSKELARAYDRLNEVEVAS